MFYKNYVSNFKFFILFLIIIALVVLSQSIDYSVSDIRNYIESYGAIAPFVFIVIFVLAIIILLPATPFDLVAGALFGVFWGSLYVVLGASIGALLVFLLSRFLGRSFIEKIVNKHLIQIKKYDDKLRDRGFVFVLFLRLVPLFPFNVLNFALGLTKVKTSSYILATIIGIIPAAIIYVYLGASLVSKSFVNIIIAFLLLLALIAIGIIFKKFRKLSKNEFDIIVIGAGSGGLNMAGFMNKAGFKVLLVDKDEKSIGGDCLNFGCVPSKALIHIARKIENARDSQKFGLNVRGKPNVKIIKKYIKKTQNIIRKHENAKYFRNLGMEVVLGEVKFFSKNEIIINNIIFKARKIIIATGSKPKKLKIKTNKNINFYTNETIFNMNELPKRFLVIGGGPIGIELGQAFQLLGSQVTVVHTRDQILNKEDSDISNLLLKELSSQGVKFFLSSTIVSFPTSDSIRIINEAKKETIIKFDAVLLAIGRELSFKDLDLEAAGIKYDEQKIVVDKYLRTTNNNTYACGDVAGSLQFTHAAELHSSIILNNFFFPLKKKLNYDNFAWVTYTYPEVATFGLREGDLKRRNVKYKIIKLNINEEDRAIISDYPEGFIKLFISLKNRLLGGTLIAPNAGELIQELILTLNARINLKNLFSKTYPYPTASRINKQAINQIFSKKLEKKLIKIILKLFYT